jgi:peptide/nickel transport system permease protein
MSSPTLARTPDSTPARIRTAAAIPGPGARLRRDPVGAAAAVVVALIVLAAVLAPWLAPTDPYETNLAASMAPPDAARPLGADAQGRDMVSRSLHGLRLTLGMAALAVAVGGALGIAVGFAAAFFRRADGLLMRLMDVLLAFPAILFGLAIAAIAGPGVASVVLAMTIATVPLMARIARGAAMIEMRRDYIEAARAVGMRPARIIWRHLAPNCASAILVFATLRLGQVMLLGSALSFVGLGAQPPTAELGAMASAGRQFLFFAPHIAVVPCVVIFVVVLAFNVLGDALRDALDPKLRI